MGLQVAKDTFYQVLRDRVAAANPARTVVVRGVMRPGVVVQENELPIAALDGIVPVDAFCLRWTELRVEGRGALPLLTAVCEIRYATDGTAGMAGLDRGRAMDAMDAELIGAVRVAPQSAGGDMVAEVAGGGASTVTTAGTRVFWGDVTLKPAVMKNERRERTWEVEVFCYGY